MLADAFADSGVFRLLSHDPKRHRVARRALSLGGRLVQVRYALHYPRSRFYPVRRHTRRWAALEPAAVDYGGNDALAGAVNASFAGHGSDSSQDHAVYAPNFHAVPLQFFRRPNPLLDRAKPAH